jgi:nitrous oxidase accessory protein NosD
VLRSHLCRRRSDAHAAPPLMTDVVVCAAGVGVPAVLQGVRTVASVGEAVGLVGSGATVHVLAGDYRESVVVDKDICVIGYDANGRPGLAPGVDADVGVGAVITGSNAGPALVLRGCSAVVRGLRLVNRSARVSAVEVDGGRGWVMEGCSVSCRSKELRMRAGGLVINSGAGTVRSCTVSDCWMMGVLVRGSGSDVTMDRCRTVRNWNSGVSVQKDAVLRMVECESADNAFHGLHVDEASNVSVMRCKLCFNERSGANVNQCPTHFVDCECVENGSCGISLADLDLARIDRCKLVRNMWGVSCSSSRAILAECDLLDNSNFGVSLEDTSDVRLDKCMVRGGDLGVHIENSKLLLTGCEAGERSRRGVTVHESVFKAHQCRIWGEFITDWTVLDSTVELDDCVVEETGWNPVK